MTAVTPLTLAEAQRAVDAYSLGSVTHCELAGTGIENSNYILALEKPDGAVMRCVLTIIETPGHTQGDAYVDLLQCCANAGLPVPVVYRSGDDQPSIEVKGKRALMSRHLPGSHVANATLLQLRAVGRFFARFHLASHSLAASAPLYPRNQDWLTQVHQDLAPTLDFHEQQAIAQGLRTTATLFQRQDVQALPKGYIHADAFRDNALFDAQGLTGIIDFHHAAHGYWLYDLAVIANDWCADSDGDLDPTRVLALLTSYDAIRPLKLAELWWFGAFAQYAALVFATSRLRSVHASTRAGSATVRHKDPQEFLQRLARQQQRPTLLDPRHFNIGGATHSAQR